MKFLYRLLGRAKATRLPAPGDFTRAYAAALAESAPGLSVSVAGDLELRVTMANRQPSTAFLHNAYEACKQDPGSTNDIIKRFVAASAETALMYKETVDQTRIVPVIKDTAWITETRQALLDRGAESLCGQVFEEFCPGLLIVYAEDSPKNIRYLTPELLEAAGVAREELRVLACANLKRLVKVERVGSNGLFMFTAGGDYEASLLLFDTIWAGLQAEVEGEVVVAVPTRDLVFATGSENVEGLSKVRGVANEAWKSGSYRLTPQLFVYRDGKFAEFDS